MSPVPLLLAADVILSPAVLTGGAFAMLLTGYVIGAFSSKPAASAKSKKPESLSALVKQAEAELEKARATCGVLSAHRSRIDSAARERLLSRTERLKKRLEWLIRKAPTIGRRGPRWTRLPAEPDTALPSRSSLVSNVETLQHATADPTTAGLLLIEIDKLEELNRKYGPSGLQVAAADLLGYLSDHLGEHDLLQHAGPGRFGILMLADSAEECLTRADKLRHAIRDGLFVIRGNEVVISASFGLACGREHESAKELLARSQEATQHSRLRGRNQLSVDESAGLRVINPSALLAN